MARLVVADPNNGNICKLLEPYIQSGMLNFLIGSGASAPAIQTAGNIETEINDHLAQGEEAEADAKSVAFLETINVVHQAILGPAPAGDAGAVLENYRRFARVIDTILFARKSQLIPRQATIFTTNYDLFVERAITSLPSLVLNDGFDRTHALTDTFPFSSERYFDRSYRGALQGRSSEIPTINLVKLHGSLSWRRKGEGLVSRLKIAKPLNDEDKANGAKVSAYLREHFLILPNLRKFHETLMDRTYYDLLRLYSRCLEHNNALVVAFGFSFADEHILDLTKRSLRNPTLHLIICAYDAASAATYQEKFADHRNVTVLAPDGAANIDFNRLNTILEDVVTGPSE